MMLTPVSEQERNGCAVEVRHVSKRFISHQHPSLRHQPLEALRSFLGGGADRSAGPQFWALQDVSFAIAHGESVGIVGRNGAGKSTLFRLICGITAPTSG